MQTTELTKRNALINHQTTTALLKNTVMFINAYNILTLINYLMAEELNFYKISEISQCQTSI